MNTSTAVFTFLKQEILYFIEQNGGLDFIIESVLFTFNKLQVNASDAHNVNVYSILFTEKQLQQCVCYQESTVFGVMTAVTAPGSIKTFSFIYICILQIK